MSTKTYTVVGMTCGHCINSVQTEVAKINGVTGVEVDLATGQVSVQSAEPVSDEAFGAAIDEAGFEVAP